MYIKFLEDCELEVVASYEEATDSIVISNETFLKGEELEADIIAESNDDAYDLQFGDGSCAKVPKKLIEIKLSKHVQVLGDGYPVRFSEEELDMLDQIVSNAGADLDELAEPADEQKILTSISVKLFWLRDNYHKVQ